MFTDQDLKTEVERALYGHAEDFDIEALCDALHTEFGTWNIDDMPDARFWAIVAEHDRSEA